MEENTLCFRFKGREPIRVRMIDGEPWFLAMDVLGALGLANGRDLMRRVLFDSERRKEILSVAYSYRKKQYTTDKHLVFISESGLYALIMRSGKKEAKEFRYWVTSEVLPSLRKTGRYEMPQPEPQKILEPQTEKVEFCVSGLQATLTLSGNLQEIADMFKRLQ